MDKRLEEIAKRIKKASPGPWKGSGGEVQMGTGEFLVCGLNGDMYPGDLEFVSHSREDIPYLLSLIKARDEALKVMGAGLEAVNGLMCASDGVSGLHLNGDIAPWAELTTGGQFEEHLSPLDEAVKVWDEIKALSGGEEK